MSFLAKGRPQLKVANSIQTLFAAITKQRETKETTSSPEFRMSYLAKGRPQLKVANSIQTLSVAITKERETKETQS